jgi:hypothetical protein
VLRWAGGGIFSYGSDQPAEFDALLDDNNLNASCTGFGCFYAQEPVVGGVEKYFYHPGEKDPGGSSNPNFAYTYIVISDTPEPSSLILVGTVALSLAGTFWRRFPTLRHLGGHR